MLFAGLWSVRMVKNCDRGLENAAAFSSPRLQFFIIRTDQEPANNMFQFFFSCSKLVLQITNGFVYATLVIESACAPSTNDLQTNNRVCVFMFLPVIL